jgi:hypothetical protein
MTVAIDASAGHSRSQKIVHRARRSARASKSSPARSGGGGWWGGATSAGRSVKSISGKESLPNIRLILTCTDASGKKEQYNCKRE